MITAVIVLYNPDLGTVIKQYNSLVNQVANIIYVDNGSSNFEEIKSQLNESSNKLLPFSIIENKENQGLGFAQNQGLKQAMMDGAKYLLLLDHDSVVKEGFVDELYRAMYNKVNVKIAAVGPVYVNEQTNEVYPITKYIGPFIKRIHPTTELEEASFLIASGSLISKEVLEDVGFMNEDLFVDYIDVYWSYKARSKGYKLFAVPTAVMNHQIGDKRITILGRKISMHSPLRRYYLTRNSIYMLRQPYISIGYKIREVAFNIARILVYTIISNDRMKYLKYSMKGLIDGLNGQFGKCSYLK